MDAVWSLKIYKLARADLRKAGSLLFITWKVAPLEVSFVKNCW